MVQKEQVTGILAEIKHPETGADIISSGFLKQIEITSNSIIVSIELPRKNDPFKSKLKLISEQKLKNQFEGFAIEVNVNHKENTDNNIPKLDQVLSKIKNIVVIASGKGGVGKSTVAVNTAVALAKAGFKTGLIDADIFGPSIPKMFGAENVQPEVKEEGAHIQFYPLEKYNVKLLSIGFFVKPGEATVWRGPMATQVLKQLIENGEWGELDYLLFDLPPGTSDIHLTLVQTVPVTGAVIVSTPQQVALIDALKGIAMFQNDKINIPILGIVENMAWFTPKELPNNKYYIFGKEGCKELAKQYNIPLLAQIPLVQSICDNGDAGTPEVLNKNSKVAEYYIELANALHKQVELRNKNLKPGETVKITHK